MHNIIMIITKFNRLTYSVGGSLHTLQQCIPRRSLQLILDSCCVQVEYKHAPNKQPSRVLKKQWQTKIKTNKDGW